MNKSTNISKKKITPESLKKKSKKIIEKSKEENTTKESTSQKREDPIKTKQYVSELEVDQDYIDKKNKVEALLFAQGKYIDESLISELCAIEKKQLKNVLDSLKEDYEKRNSALAIFQEGNSWKINVREKYLSIVRKIVADTELSKSVMETLAVIAWKSPIYQSEVVRIRGNKCYDHIELLEDTGFITKDKKGRSYILKTTDKFYNYFEIDHGNLKSIFEEVKVPIKEEQKTLEENIKVPENIDIEKKIEHIELKKWTETDEEKEQQKQFLKIIEEKIQEVQQKTKTFEEEIPRINTESSAMDEKIEETPKYMSENNNSGMEKNPLQTEENKKQRPFTKKQLEKKFRDDIKRVREKMENK